MTPFGIRNRIKAVLGRSNAPAATVEQISLEIQLPNGSSQTVRCEAGYTLVMASQSLETPLATNCPDGHCGDCVVDLVEGKGLRVPTQAEQKLIEEKYPGQNVRLACHARIESSGAKVKARRLWTMDQVKGS